ncbi:2-nitropropane dioxygenase [Mycena rosella]|uniref:2-nitropropane dioxygenase n=1 Tax=Mycena rosella TaxID=1033263 RepID=A0AAD7CVD8_MYCRO|nr:2-nitropropane dioxygenase [Mycena rosella]
MFPTINTPLTKRLNIITPILSAPMPFASTPEMVSAVTAAGGFGCLGSAFESVAVMKEKIQSIRTHLKITPGTPVPIAVGFLGWILDKTEVSDEPRLLAILDELPVAVWFSFGDDLGKYIANVRAHDRGTERHTFIFVVISSVESARRFSLAGADALVVQGIEAGGHGAADAPPLFSLLQAVLHDVQPGPIILAAGGISTGAQIAALLTMGVDGVVLGTRFLFTPECEYSPAQKDVLVKAGLAATVRTMAFDEVARRNGWPANCDGRAISNAIMDDYNAGLSLDERVEKFDESTRNGDNSRLVIWAGVGAGLTSEIKGAADVLRELHNETIVNLRRSATLLE